MKRFVFLLAAVAVGTGIQAANAVYDAGEALAANLGKDGMFTDCAGGTWTFGTIGAADLSDVQAIGWNYSDGGWFEGVTAANNSPTPPFAIVNTSSTPQTHGNETGNIPLAPGEIVLHPDNPSKSARPYVGIRFQPPRAGVYRIDAAVRDMSYGNGTDGVIASLYAKGMIQQSVRVGREIGMTNTTFAVVLYLPEDESVTLIIDPNGTYNHDSTGVFFTLTELAVFDSEPIVDLNETYVGIVRSGTSALPVTTDGVTVSAGTVSNKTEVASFTTPHAEAGIGCAGFTGSGNFPYVLANTNASPSACDNNILVGTKLLPHELLLHPNKAADAFVRLTVPSAGVYRAVGIFRDLSVGNRNYGYGVIPSIATKNFGCCASGFVSAEDEVGPIVLDARRMELDAGDAVIFQVNNNGTYNFDSTGLQAYLFADTAPTTDEVVNLDINGRQAADPEPVTYTGAAKYAAAGTFWNSIYGQENTVLSVAGDGLRTAGGMRTLVSVSISSTDGTNLMFDNLANNANMAGNDLLSDYLYVNHTNRLAIAGLVPGNSYDLHLYCACGKRYAPNNTHAVFGGQVRRYSVHGGRVFLTADPDVLVFSGLVADAAGVIEGLLVGTPGSQGVFNGFQLVGEFTFPPPGMTILFR